MASPSAPTCVVTATLSRVFKNSAISEAVLFFVRVVIGPYLPKGCFYPGRAFYHRVGLEVQLRRALESRLGADGGLYAARRALQSLMGRIGVFARDHAVVNRRMGEV